jgi:hypothetical protein
MTAVLFETGALIALDPAGLRHLLHTLDAPVRLVAI